MENKFIGKWNLKSMINIAENGDEIFPFGKKVKGMLIYSEDGYMSVQLASKNRKDFRNNDHRKGTKDEIYYAFNSYISYYGKYEIQKDRGQIVHEVQLSLYPNWINTKQRRYFTFIDEKLVLEAKPLEQDGRLFTPTLTWERIK